MSSLERVNPVIRPLSFNQNIEEKDHEKKIPSIAAKAITLSPKVDFLSAIHGKAQSVFFLTYGTVSIALNKNSLFWGSLMCLLVNCTGLSEHSQ